MSGRERKDPFDRESAEFEDGPELGSHDECVRQHAERAERKLILDEVGHEDTGLDIFEVVAVIPATVGAAEHLVREHGVGLVVRNPGTPSHGEGLPPESMADLRPESHWNIGDRLHMEMEPGRGYAFQIHRVFEEVEHLLEICVNDLGASQ